LWFHEGFLREQRTASGADRCVPVDATIEISATR
jgi:hypothetical protein